MKQNYNLFVVGNGLDIALGIKSSYSDFHSYVKKEFLGKYYSSRHERHFLISEKEFNHFIEFIEKLNFFLKEKNIDDKECLWSDLEWEIVKFFENEYISSDNKINDKLKEGFRVFLLVLQKYYAYDLYEEQINIGFNSEYKDSLLALFNFIYFDLSVSQTTILSFNYTNFCNYFLKNNIYTQMNEKLDLYPMHFHVSAIIFLFGEKFSKNYPFSGVNENVFLLNELKENNPLTKIEIAEDRRKIIDNMHNIMNGNSDSISHVQACVFGTTQNLPDNLSFLSKNKGLYYIDHGRDYPNKILGKITEKIDNLEKHIKVTLYIFGYSFGATDEIFNDWIFEKILNGKIGEIIFLYFKKDRKFSWKNYCPLKRTFISQLNIYIDKNSNILNLKVVKKVKNNLKIRKRLI